MSGNKSIGGPGGIAFTPIGQTAGPVGSAFGGAIFSTNSMTLLNVTLAGNSGQGGAVFSSGQTALHNTILASSVSGGNCQGTFTDAGHNISSDDSCPFNHVGSRINTDPKLEPLTDNGGSTLTMALLPGSPAINAGDDAACPAVDQRGLFRPSLGRCDIGAYEFGASSFRIAAIEPVEGAQVRIRGVGLANQAYSLRGSADLANWQTVGGGTVSAEGQFEILTPATAPVQFYRILAP